MCTSRRWRSISGCPCLSIMGVGPWTSPCALHLDGQQRDAGSPGSRAGCVGTCMGSQTARGLPASRAGEAVRVAFRVLLSRRHPEVSQFRGSIPNPSLPLSTLHARPYGRQRMTQGQSGSLDLLCVALASTTPCRFIRRTAGCGKTLVFPCPSGVVGYNYLAATPGGSRCAVRIPSKPDSSVTSRPRHVCP